MWRVQPVAMCGVTRDAESWAKQLSVFNISDAKLESFQPSHSVATTVSTNYFVRLVYCWWRIMIAIFHDETVSISLPRKYVPFISFSFHHKPLNESHSSCDCSSALVTNCHGVENFYLMISELCGQESWVVRFANGECLVMVDLRRAAPGSWLLLGWGC